MTATAQRKLEKPDISLSTNCSIETVKTLRDVLGLGRTTSFVRVRPVAKCAQQAQNGKAPGREATGRKRATTGRAIAGVNVCAKGPVQGTLQDEAVEEHDRVQLASKVYNESLKILSQALKDAPAEHGNSAGPVGQYTGREQRDRNDGHETSIQRSALRPVRNPPGPRIRPTKSTKDENEQPSKTLTHLSAVAECSCLALAFLRENAAHSKSAMSEAQLRQASFALIGKLVSFGLTKMTNTELRHLKRALNGHDSPHATQNLATESLLEMSSGTVADSDDASVLSYITLVIKSFAIEKFTASIESIVTNLTPNRTDTGFGKLLQRLNGLNDAKKITAQLDSLSRAILILCPGVSATLDGTINQMKSSISVYTVLKLQTLVFMLRVHSWRMHGHEAKLEQELWEPFAKCVMAFLRRSRTPGHLAAVEDTSNEILETLRQCDFCKIETSVAVLRCLAKAAELDGLTGQYVDYQKEIAKCLTTSQASGAASLAVEVSIVAARLGGQRSVEHATDTEECLQAIECALAVELCGSAAEQDALLGEFGSLRKAVCRQLISASKRMDDGVLYAPLLHTTSARALHSCCTFARRYMGSLGASTEQDSRASERTTLMHRLLGPLVDSLSLLVQTSTSNSLVPWTQLDDALKSCHIIAGQLMIHGKSANQQQHDVPGSNDLSLSLLRLSNIYWRWSSAANKSGASCNEITIAQRASVDILRDLEESQRVENNYTVKLERLALNYDKLEHHIDRTKIYLEAAKELVGYGLLQQVLYRASGMALEAAWYSDSKSQQLSRILKELLRDPRRQTTHAAWEDLFAAGLCKLSRMTLLEWRLFLAAEKLETEQDEWMQSSIRLLELCDPEDYPLRRTRNMTRVLSECSKQQFILNDQLRDLITEQRSKSNSGLGNDVDLAAFQAHISASFQATVALWDPEPSLEALSTSLTTWQTILGDPSPLSRIDDLDALLQLLQAVVGYLSYLGQQKLHAMALQVLIDVMKMNGGQSRVASSVLRLQAELADLCLKNGLYNKALSVLKSSRMVLAEQKVEADRDDVILWHAVFLEYHLCLRQPVEATRVLAEIRNLAHSPTVRNSEDGRDSSNSQCSPDVAARLALSCSSYATQLGQWYPALALARQAVKIYQKMWARLENAMTRTKKSDRDVREARDDHGDLSKQLQDLSISSEKGLREVERTKDETLCLDGAAFWPLVPKLLHAYLQLSNVYAFVGLWQESVHNVQLANKLAGTASPSIELQCVARLLELHTRGNRLPAAAGYQLAVEGRASTADFIVEDLNYAKAVWRFNVAMKNEEGAAACERKLVKLLEVFESGDLQQAITGQLCDDDSSSTKPRVTARRKVNASISSKKSSSRTLSRKKEEASINASPAPSQLNVVDLSGIRIDIASSQIRDMVQQNRLDDAQILVESLSKERTARGQPFTLAKYELEYAKLGRHATHDFVLDTMIDSSLAIPALRSSGSNPDEQYDGALQASKTPKIKGRFRSKVTSRTSPTSALSKEAETCLVALKEHASDMSTETAAFPSNYDSRQSCRAVAEASLLSSVATFQTCDKMSSPDAICKALETAGYISMRAERASVLSDVVKQDASDAASVFSLVDIADDLQLPAGAESPSTRVDGIPETWTVISLTVNETRNELYVSRYQAMQDPFVLRLPLTRGNNRESSEEAFGFQEARAELAEIMTKNEATTHSGATMSAKGAKSDWWAEREALDERLKGFLVNVENIWFGGFKSVLAKSSTESDRITDFGECLEKILNRHLPSRQGNSSGQSPKFSSHVLQLFIGLDVSSADNEGDTQVDEELLDLLYLVVDVLRLNGEANAYDEVDFDAITVKVIDALVAHHGAGDPSPSEEEPHTILVLDKMLHAFPWECMPCLKGRSVSRLPSMAMLRNLLQRLNLDESTTDGTKRGLRVSVDSGTTVLNPSGDLERSQQTLQPFIDQLPSSWIKLVGKDCTPAIDEKFLTSTLKSSEVFLYLGHGSTAQFARPRAVKRLCPSIVADLQQQERALTRSTALLMGCSSAGITENGEYEPHGMVLAYLTAGAPAVVGCLWDVTDRDCDRFSIECGRRWGLWDGVEGKGKNPIGAGSGKRGRGGAAGKGIGGDVEDARDATVRVRREKTKSGKKKAGKAHTQERDEELAGNGDDLCRGTLSLPHAVAASRDTCYLEYLNGAAFVVYGIPVYIERP